MSELSEEMGKALKLIVDSSNQCVNFIAHGGGEYAVVALKGSDIIPKVFEVIERNRNYILGVTPDMN